MIFYNKIIIEILLRYFKEISTFIKIKNTSRHGII